MSPVTTRASESVRAEVVGDRGEPGEPPALPAQDVSPEPLRIAGEQIVGPGVEHEPRAGVDLALELAGTPAGVAPEHPDRFDLGCHQSGIDREVGGDQMSHDGRELVGRLVEFPVRTSERDQRVRLDRSTVEHRHGGGLQLVPAIERLVEPFRGGPVDDDTQRTVHAVFEDEHHGAVEVRVVERGSGQQQATCGWRRTELHPTSVPGPGTIHRSIDPPIRLATRPDGVLLAADMVLACPFVRSYDHAFMIKVGIIGASGFTGAELLRLVAHHPEFEVVYATGDTQVGVPAIDLYPSLSAVYPDLVFESLDLERARDLDVAFLGLPHLASMVLAPELVGHVRCVVDLSAAYRLRDASAYPLYYGFAHEQPELLDEAVYGLPEQYRNELLDARLVATPGCYVTAATLALAPLVAAGMIERTGVIVDAASGVTGAGRAPKHETAFVTVDENFTAYGLIDHRHTPEMEQEIGAEVLFTPHLVPMNRGILATCYARPLDGIHVDTDAVLDVLHSRYADEPFVVVSDSLPSTKATLGSNTVQLTARHDPRTGHVIVLSALDNLTKGASGGAVQSANVALGLEETAGLPRVGMMP